MAILKYKNGSTWKEVNVSSSADIDKIYPIGSVYLKLYNSVSGSTGSYKWDSSHYSRGITNISSPAEEIGGNWIIINAISGFNPTSQDFNTQGGFYGMHYGKMLSFPAFYQLPYQEGFYIAQSDGTEQGFSPIITKNTATWYIDLSSKFLSNGTSMTNGIDGMSEAFSSGQLIGWVRIS